MSAAWRRRLLIILSLILASVLGRTTKGPAWLEGVYYDTALAVRAYLQPDAPNDAGVLVVGLDEASLSYPDLAQRPRALFAPVWAQTVTALRTAGAQVIAFDFILAFSGEKIAPGYDRTFLRALYENRDHIVLGRSQALLPAQSYSAALGLGPMSLGLSEITPDADGVFRQVPLRLGEENKAFALGGAALAQAGYTDFPDRVRLAPRQAVDSLPAISLWQVLACSRSDPEALKKAVDGRIVFIGTVLEEEDRKPGPSRFFFPDPQNMKAAVTAGAAPGCDPEHTSKGTDSIPGVYLHAQAVNQILGRNLLSDLNVWLATLIYGAVIALVVAAVLVLRPVLTLFTIIGVCLALWFGELAALGAGYYAAMGYLSLLCLIFGGVSFVFRLLLEERRRMRMQRAFGHYLAPELVRRLSESEAMPTLDGELRQASVMFADLSGFTALSSRLPASEVVALTNQYLGLMAEEIEASKGYIDKYIGDAVMAVWGAPINDADHAKHAVLCAQRITHRISQMYAEAAQRGADGFSVKIGVNSGPIIAGNVGAQKRLNYTAIGDTVNVAARLESVPGDYGCMLVIGEQTAALLDDSFVLRELDLIAVKGRSIPLRIFEPVDEDSVARNSVAGYALALARYRNRDFGGAASLWEKQAQAGDRPASVMAARARQLLDDTPLADWDGVWRKMAK
ncbi:MAG: adenylate/guanylate cyclase domain-containing protein [Alphaproteobacteria bacterium]